MNPELKAKWIADLRANPQLQGRFQLRSFDNKFCCLGRLREIAGFEWTKFPVGYAHAYGNITGLDVAELISTGLTFDEQGKLMIKNDAGETFAQIADWIEENL